MMFEWFKNLISNPPPSAPAMDAAQLEDRVMLSASPLSAALQAGDQAPATDDLAAQTALTDSTVPAPLTTNPESLFGPADQESLAQQRLQERQSESLRLELVFVDPGTENYQQLIEDFLKHASPERELEIYLLDAHESGIEQISSILGSYQDVDALHVISHGNDGQIKLGNSWLSSENLTGYAKQIATWNDSLKSNSDVLIYGCDLAASESGRTLVDSIAALCGCDVAASDDDTGHAALGGDWELEYREGVIEAELAVSLEAQQSWRQLLNATPVGGVINVNETPNFDEQTTINAGPHAIASAANGDFVAVWESDAQDSDNWGIYARRFNADGTPIASEFLVNTTTTGDQTNPAVAVNASGAFVVVFQSEEPPLADKSDIYAVLYDNTGTVLKSEFRVNEAYIGNHQTDAAVAMRDDGSFIVSWTSRGQDGDKEGIYAQIFDPSGNASGGLIQVNNVVLKEQLYSSIATNSSGEFIVTWSSKNLNTNKFDIQARRFDAGGTPGGRQFTVDQNTSDNQLFSDVALSDDGSFILTWMSENQDSNSDGIYARRYDADAQPIDDEFLVHQSTPASAENSPSIALDNSGNFVVTWTTDDIEVYAREFDALGAPTTAGNIHITTLANDQFGGAIAMADNSDYVVLFSGEGPGDFQGVFAQRYDVSALPTVDVNGAAAGVDHTAAFVEDGGPVSIVAADAAITDLDSLQLQKLSVVITNLLDGTDESLIADTSGTSLTANYAAGIMTIEGTGPTDISQFETVLRTLRYTNASQAPNTAARSVRFIAHDTSLFTGASASTVVSIEALNDAPVISAPATESTDEDTSLVFSSAAGNAISMSDDAGVDDVEVTLTGTNGTVTLSSRLGPESRANMMQPQDQKAPSVAVARDGRYVVVWHAKNGVDDDIFARTFNADGTAISGDIAVVKNANNDQRNAAVAMDDFGNFVVTWEHDTENVADKWDVYARTFDIDGNPLGGNEIQINDTKTNHQTNSRVALDNDGQFIVVWQSSDGTKDVYFRAYDLQLNDLTGSEIVVNTTTASDQARPDVAIKTDGQFVITWDSKDQDGSGQGIYLKRFDVDYNAIDANDVLVNFGHTADNQRTPSVAVNDSGQIVVAWESHKQDDPDDKWGVYAQRFDFTSGTGVGTEIAVNTTTEDDQLAPDVAIADDGTFVVVWQSSDQDNDDGFDGVYLQEFDASGVKLGTETLVNTETLENQSSPAVGMRPGSPQYVAVWQSQDQDSTGDDGIYHQRFLRPGALNFVVGDGIDDVVTTVSGRVADISQAMDGFVFTPTSDYNGPASVQIDIDDLGNSGTGGTQQDTHLVNITVNPVNDAPQLTTPLSTQQVRENQPFTFSVNDSNATSIWDVDSNSNDLRVTLSVINGVLSVDLSSGITITGGANDSALVEFTGTETELNDALDGLIYTPDISYLGPDTLSINVDDLGNSGSGGPLVANGSININVFDYNIPPVNNFPSSIATPENTTFTFDGPNTVSITDNDAAGTDDIDVRLSVTHGLLKLAGNPGISITGDWSGGDVQLLLDGDKDLVNSALSSLTFTPDANYAGPASLLIQTNDQGNSGIDGDKSDADIIQIDVTPDAVNDAPTLSSPTSATTDEETPLAFTSANSTAIQVNDDADGNPIRVTLTAADGVVSLSNSAGTQFQVNTTIDKHQRDAAVAMSVSGDFVMVWESENQDGDGYGIYAQRYDNQGLPIDSEFKINATAHKHQTDPAVAMTDDGSFVVAWVSEDQDGNNKGIFAQRYDSNGQKLGGEFQVNSFTNKAQQSPDIAMDATGRFVIVWESDDQDGDDWGIYGQVYDNSGNQVGAEFRANFTTAKDQRSAAVAMDVDGDFVVTWQHEQPGIDKWDIRARRFDASGNAKDATDITVNTVVDERQEAPDVSMDASGRYVIAWQSKDLDYPDGKFGIYHRRFEADGTPSTAQQELVNTHVANEQKTPAVAMSRNGDYVISWESRRQDDPTQGDKYGVFAQRYDADGTARDGEFQVNTTTNKDQKNSAIAAGNDGRFIVVWESDSEDGDNYGVFAQRYKDVSNLTFLQGDGTDDPTMQFEGTVDQVNDALDGLVFTPAVDFDFATDGLTTLQIDVDDLGNTGSGGSQSASRSIDITVNPINDAPTFTIPAPQTAYEEVPLVFSITNGNQLAVSDVDATTSPIQVSLTGTNGTLTLNGTSGLTFSSGTGSDDVTMTFTGTLTDINAALDGLSYTAPAGSAGTGTVHVSAHDLGNTGTGGAGTNNDVVTINVEQDFTNDPPQILVPGPQQTNQNQPLRISDLDGNAVTIQDDAVANPIRVQLTVTDGILDLSKALGTEFLVNTETAQEQRWSSISAAPTGEFVVVWQSDEQDGDKEGVFGQRYNSDGQKVGPEFRVNQFTSGSQDDPSVAMAPSGEFVVAWTSADQDGNSGGVFGRKYDSSGNPVGDEFLVNSSTSGLQNNPAVAIDSGGRFVVVWEGVGVGDDIYAQRFDENGVAQGPEFIVNTTTTGNQEMPTVALDAAGNFMVAWEASDADLKGIFAQRFDSSGNMIGVTEFAVNTIEDNNDQELPVAAMNASGQFVIVWQGEDSDGLGIRASLYDATANLVREDFIVNELEIDLQATPTVAINDSGEFVVAWYADDGNKEVYARNFDSLGLPSGSQYLVNSTTNNTQNSPSAAITADGGTIISWTSDNQDGDFEGVYAARFIPDGAVTFHAGTGTADSFMDIEGSAEHINGLLNGMVFTPDNGFTGLATVAIDVNDQGHTGTGGPHLRSDTLLISVDGFPFLDLDADDSSGADGTGFTVHFAPGGAPVDVMDSDFLVQTPESELKSVTITLTNRPDGANEVLTADTSAFIDISHSYDSGTGELSITGQDVVANYLAVLGTVQYDNSASAPDAADRIITVQFRDKRNDDSNLATTTILIDKQPPVVDVVGNLDYTEGDPPTVIASFASVTDPDTANFAGGKLLIDMASSGTTSDRFLVRNEGTGIGQISVVGSDVRYNSGSGPVTIGTFATAGPWNGLATLQLDLNADSDAAAVTAVISNVVFENVSSSPATHLRAVRFVLHDGEGAVSETASATIRVTDLPAQPPVLSGIESSPLAYTEGDPATAITNTLTISDLDDTELEGAVVRVTGNYQSGEDVLAFADTASITGSWNAGTGSLTLSGIATIADYQSALRSITYTNTSDDPSTAVRTIEFQVTDGELFGTTSRDVSVSAVNDPPTLVNLTGDTLVYTTGTGPQVIEQSADAAALDVDSIDFDTGNLTVSIPSGGNPLEDVLSIRDQGSGAGQIGFDGFSVTYSGTQIGTASGGLLGLPLVVSFNANATPTAASALLQNITYQNSNVLLPTTGLHTIRFTIDDGDGGTSLNHDAVVNVNQPNTAPTITSSNAPTTTENTTLAVALTASDPEAPPQTVSFNITGGADQGLFVINGSNELEFLSAPDFESPADVDTDNIYEVEVTADDGNGGTAAQTISVTVIDSTVLDQFNAVSYSGDDGPTNWSNDWQEIGETQNPSAGRVRVVGNRLRIGGNEVSINGRGILREANFDGATAATLTFAYQRQLLDESGGSVALGVSNNGGASWTTLKTYNLNGTDSVPINETFDVSAFTAADMQIRFLGAGSDVESYFFVDDVQITDESTGNNAPVITSDGGGSTAAVGVAENTTNVTTVTASDANGDSIAYAISGGSDAAHFSIDGVSGDLTFNTPRDFETPADANADNVYDVEVTADDGNGASDVQTINVTVTNVNEAPQVSTTPGSLSYTEGDGPQIVDAGVALADVDDTNLEGATVQVIVGYAPAEDVLVFVDQLGITGTWNAGTGSLTLTGTASLADYQTALQSITYENTSDAPSTAFRTVSFQVTDGAANGSGSRSISVLAVNDAPTITNLAGDTLNYTTGTGPRVIEQSTDAAAFDADSIDFDSGNLTVIIVSGGNPLEDVLSIRDQGSGAGQIGFDGLNVSFGGTPIGTVAGGLLGAPLIVTFNASANPAAASALLQNITYENANVLTPTTGLHTIRFTMDDGDGGTSLNHDTAVNVNTGNTAPTITSSSTPTAAENSTLAVALTASDPEAPPQIVTFNITGGADQSLFSINGSNELVFSAAPDFESPADADANSVYEVEVTADDGNGGTDIQTVSVTVTNVNEAPVLAVPASVSVAENNLAVTVVSSTDVDGGAPSYSVVGGADAVRFQVDATTGALTFITAPNFEVPTDANADNTYEVAVRVEDGNGGSDQRLVSVTVTDANDAPSASNDHFTLKSDETLLASAPGVLSGDADEDGHALTVSLVTGPVHGTLVLNADGSFLYTPEDGYLGLDVFWYQIDDGFGGTAAGAVTLSVTGFTTLPPTIPPPEEPPPEPLPEELAPADEPPVTPLDELDAPDDVDRDLPLVPSSRTSTENLVPITATILNAQPDLPLAVGEVPVFFESYTASVVAPRAALELPAAQLQILEQLGEPALIGLLPQDLEELEQALLRQSSAPLIAASAFAGVSTILTAGYVVWTIRAGWLVTSLMAQMPAWRLVDPLVVLEYLDDDSEGGPGDRDDDSLESILERHDQRYADGETDEVTTELELATVHPTHDS